MVTSLMARLVVRSVILSVLNVRVLLLIVVKPVPICTTPKDPHVLSNAQEIPIPAEEEPYLVTGMEYVKPAQLVAQLVIVLLNALDVTRDTNSMLLLDSKALLLVELVTNVLLTVSTVKIMLVSDVMLLTMLVMMDPVPKVALLFIMKMIQLGHVRIVIVLVLLAMVE